jgi:NAD(P)-dependent dehydrogenase (short-subunit alcohol dehydrogenase family)
MADDLTGQVVLISGAGRGIGAATARLVAQRGAAVGVLDIDRALAEATSAAITASGGKALTLIADVADRAAIMDAAEALKAEYGPLTGLVSDAIWIRYGPIEGITEDVLDRMMAVGIKGPIWGIQALLATRVLGPVSVVNLTSPLSEVGSANTATYTAIKGAIAALTRQQAVELGPQGIRVNAVTPGAVPTPGARGVVDEEGYARRKAQTPLGRLGTEDDIATAIAFLLSDDAAFITGTILRADGGITIKSV